VPCDKSKIQQVLLNILKNGAEAMADQGTWRRSVVHPGSFCEPAGRAMAVRIEIADNGPGMDEATRKRLFEPFFTTKPVNRGTGLGLSVSYFIITENTGGHLDRVLRQGSRDRLRDPVAVGGEGALVRGDST